MVWLLVLALAPGVFWLWYFRRRDALRPEPRALVGRVFAYGGIAAVAAAAVEAPTLAGVQVSLEGPFIPVSLLSAAIVGAVEETAKLAALYVGVYRLAQFDEVMDGILYAVTASLGFASVENIAYVVQGGPGVAVLRAVLSIPGHTFFGAVMGFYIGVSKFAGTSRPAWIAAGLVLAAASHAAYDAAIFTGTWVGLTVIPFVLLLGVATLQYVRRALAMDDARLGRPFAAAPRRP